VKRCSQKKNILPRTTGGGNKYMGDRRKEKLGIEEDNDSVIL